MSRWWASTLGWLRTHSLALGGALVALLGLAFGVTTRRRLKHAQSEPTAEERRAAEARTRVVQVAHVVRQKAQDEATQEHTQAVTALVASEQKSTLRLATDVFATNDYLKSVGTEVRGDTGKDDP